ncbi:MAG: L,D-transpeptidase family protein [Pseudomonadota bacterium]
MSTGKKLLGLLSILFLSFPLILLPNLSEGLGPVTTSDEPTKGATLEKIPNSLINVGDGSPSHIILVEKSKQKLYLYSFNNNEYRLLKTFKCSTGENGGDKEREGDMRTPEGVYFVTRIIDGRRLPRKYGVKAFVLDYPNYLDRRRDKDGKGIWLHGTNKELVPTDTNGCVALENEDIVSLSKYIEPYRTPIVIEERIDYLDRDTLLKDDSNIRDFIDKWIAHWESKELEKYMSSYSERFKAGNMDWESWKAQKKSINRRYSAIDVTLEDVRIFRHSDTVMVVSLQGYHSNRFNSFGVKRLYLEREGKDWKIIGEQWKPLPPSLGKLQARLAKRIPKSKEEVLTKFTPESEVQSIHSFVSTWKKYWESKELDGYMSCYSERFRSKNMDWQSWRGYKKALNEKVHTISVEISDIKILEQKGIVVVTFRQDYRSDRHADTGIKRLYLEKEGNNWKIIGEDWKSFLERGYQNRDQARSK